MKTTHTVILLFLISVVLPIIVFISLMIMQVPRSSPHSTCDISYLVGDIVIIGIVLMFLGVGSSTN
jgi:hypothetical protein